eukprot:scaffold11076_cov122-Cylindrotheca_fusiformis.AAC.4
MDLLPRPSGRTLPMFLLKKWQAQQLAGKSESAPRDQRQTDHTDHPPRKSRKLASAFAKHVFTTEELDDRLYKTSVVIEDIQKQIVRGEEIYYEETVHHGNLFRGGWDSFVDAKDVGVGDTGFTRSTNQGSNRTVPNDAKWFSHSCLPKKRKELPAPPVNTTSATNFQPFFSSGASVPHVASNLPAPVAGQQGGASTATNCWSENKPQLEGGETPVAGVRIRKRADPSESDPEPVQKKPKMPNQKDSNDDGEKEDLVDAEQGLDAGEETGVASNKNQSTGSKHAADIDGGTNNAEVKKEGVQNRRKTRNRR